MLKLSFICVFFSFCLIACNQPDANKQKQKVAPQASSKKELIVVTHNGPNTYYVDGNNEFAGLEYDLVKLFAQELGEDYTVKFLTVDNISQVIPTLLKGKAHIAAADLSITRIRQELVLFSTPYNTTQELIVYNKEVNEAPKKIEHLIGKSVAVPAGTSYAERLGKIVYQVPELDWQELSTASTYELLEEVAENLLDYTIADSHLVLMLQNFYPNLGAGMPLGEPEDIAWAFPKNGDPLLYKKANVFFAKIKKDGTLRNLIDRYYGHSKRLDTTDVTTYLKRIRFILPQYKQLFKEAQELTNTDWRLIAAIAYRESHWDKLNTSPTNVRGLMMLTESTADKLGVTDRLDPKQSIMGGARYILELKDMIPERIPEPDRTWMALAAYNIGYAHLEDARVLAQRLKLNPDSWADLKKTLPLLNKQEYYSTLKYGYASGGAPVIFVESIRTYYQILQHFEPAHEALLTDFKISKK